MARKRTGMRLVSSLEVLERRELLAVVFPPPEVTFPISQGSMTTKSIQVTEEYEDATLDLLAGTSVSFLITEWATLASENDVTRYQVQLLGPNQEPVIQELPALDSTKRFLADFRVPADGTYTLRIHASRPMYLDATVYSNVETKVVDSAESPMEPLPLQPRGDGVSRSAEFVLVPQHRPFQQTLATFDQPDSIVDGSWSSSTLQGRAAFLADGITGGSLMLEAVGGDPTVADRTQNMLVFRYDAATGNFSMESPTGRMTAVEIVSAEKRFQGTNPFLVGGNPFDVFRPEKLFFIRMNWAGDSGPTAFFDYGPVLPAGLSLEAVARDLTVASAFEGGYGTSGFWVLAPHEPIPDFATTGPTVIRATWPLPASIGGRIVEFDYQIRSSLPGIVGKRPRSVANIDILRGSDHSIAASQSLSCPANTTCHAQVATQSADLNLLRWTLASTWETLVIDNVTFSGPTDKWSGQKTFPITLEHNQLLNLDVSSTSGSIYGFPFDHRPQFRLLDAQGEVVTASDGEMSLSYLHRSASQEPMDYYLRVVTTDPTSVSASVIHQEPVATPLSVGSTSSVAYYGTMEIQFTRPIDFRSCQGATIEMPGVQWKFDTASDLNRLHFTTDQPLPMGHLPLTVPAGICRDLWGNENAAFEAMIDYQPPQLESISIQPGTQLTAGNAHLLLRADEELASVYSWNSLQLEGPDGRRPLSDYESMTVVDHGILISLGNLTPGHYRLLPNTLSASDPHGNWSEWLIPELHWEVVAPRLSAETDRFDLDRNGQVDRGDLNLLQLLLLTSGERWSWPLLGDFDLNRDLYISWKDESLFIREALGIRDGDVNLDGIFDQLDLDLLARSTAVDGWFAGDFDEDGDTDSANFVLAMQVGEFG